MLSTEKPQFEALLAILFAGFPTFLTPPRVEAYWKGLSKMQLGAFERCVEQILGETGEEKLPTPNRIWQISKAMRATQSQPNHQEDVAPIACKYLRHANRVLLHFLCRHPQPDATLAAMVDAKNYWAKTYRLICEDEPEASRELMPKLVLALNEITGLRVEPAMIQSDARAAWRS